MSIEQLNSPGELLRYTNISPVDGLKAFVIKDLEINVPINLGGSYRSISIINCILNQEVSIANVKSSEAVTIINTQFKKGVSISESVFSSKARFHNTIFREKLNFNNVRFEALADFYEVTFSKNIIFYKVDFLGAAVFTLATFKDNVLFTYTKVTDIIIFKDTSFEKGFDLSTMILIGKLSASGIDPNNFKDYPDIDDTREYTHAISELGIITRNNQRETYRILKKHYKDQSDTVLTLRYSKLENDVYYKQLKQNVFSKNKWREHGDDLAIFYMNKISNNHNLSWFSGLIFTLITAIVFFYPMIMLTDNFYFCFNSSNFLESVGYGIKYFLEFLSPVHKSDFIDKEGSNVWTYLLDFVGRIFVGYGIYQTVQAFRKHKG